MLTAKHPYKKTFGIIGFISILSFISFSSSAQTNVAFVDTSSEQLNQTGGFTEATVKQKREFKQKMREENTPTKIRTVKDKINKGLNKIAPIAKITGEPINIHINSVTPIIHHQKDEDKVNGANVFYVTGTGFQAGMQIIGQITYPNGNQTIITYDHVTVNSPADAVIDFRDLYANLNIRWAFFMPDSPNSFSNIVHVSIIGKSASFSPGDIACTFKAETPQINNFNLYGTCPLPQGLYPTASGINPFGMINADGSIVEAQVDIAARYPDNSASIIEVTANVDLPNNPGSFVEYDLVFHDFNMLPPNNLNTIPFLSGVPGLPSNVSAEILQPGKIIFSSEDYQGKLFTLDALSGHNKITKGTDSGNIKRAVRTYDVLKPLVPASLPHLMGVYAYLTTQKNSDIILMDIRVTNAANGMDPADPSDDAFNELFFKNLKLSVPSGWAVVQLFEDPYFINTPFNEAPGYNTYHLVKSLTGSQMHFMPRHGQFSRRLAIAPVNKTAQARRMLEMEGFGFSADKMVLHSSTGQMVQNFSWWNEQTGRFFPQSNPLPNLDHTSLNSLRSNLTNSYNSLKNKIVSGTSTNYDYPIPDDVMGWAHPYGVGYGGMTSGSEIHIYDGVREVYAASNHGLLNLEGIRRMYDSRERIFLVNKDGSFNEIHQHVFNCPYVSGLKYQKAQYSTINNVPTKLDQDNPWGFNNPAYNQAGLVTLPYYWNTLNGYDIIDTQHKTRTTRVNKVLSYLKNDDLSKDYLFMLANGIESSLTVYPRISSWNQTCPNIIGSLKGMAGSANSNPGFATANIGRGEAWQLDAMNTAYSFWPLNERQANLYWFEKYVDMASTTQIACTGFWQSNYNPGKLLQNHRARQSFEGFFNETAFLGTMKSVFEGVDPARSDNIKNMLTRALYGNITSPIWKSNSGPWRIMATGNIAGTEVYCPGVTNYTSDMFTGLYHSAEYENSVGLGFKLTNDPVFLQKGQEVYGSNLLNYLQNAVDDNSFNSHAVYTLRVMQEQDNQY